MTSEAVAQTSESVAPSAASREELEQAERRARHFWVTTIVGLLSLQVAIGVTSILLAVGDPSVAIIPHYHQSALDWDATQRTRHLMRTLGWQIQTTVGPPVADGQQRVLQIQVRDRSGQPVPNLRIVAKSYHHARGADIHEMHLQETQSGSYEAVTSLVQAGLWQVQLQIEGDHGLASDQFDITVSTQ